MHQQLLNKDIQIAGSLIKNLRAANHVRMLCAVVPEFPCELERGQKRMDIFFGDCAAADFGAFSSRLSPTVRNLEVVFDYFKFDKQTDSVVKASF